MCGWQFAVICASHCRMQNERLRCFWLGWCCAAATPLRMSAAKTQKLVLMCCFIVPSFPPASTGALCLRADRSAPLRRAHQSRKLAAAEQKSTSFRSTGQAQPIFTSATAQPGFSRAAPAWRGRGTPAPLPRRRPRRSPAAPRRCGHRRSPPAYPGTRRGCTRARTGG